MTCTYNTNIQSNQTILVTDSGLGGLSVFNDIVNRLKHKSPWPAVRMIYFNAWPAPLRGYNHFDTSEKKATVFNNALSSMTDFTPDQILIACNTLSVIYPQTEFHRSSDIAVSGIVDHGVKILHKKLVSDPESVAVILGTPTTTSAKSHENGLISLGIEKRRIINTGCTNLAGWIEKEPFSPEVGRMITHFAEKTAQKTGPVKGRVFAGLCCTHFGYKGELFKKALEAQYGPEKVTILNPNTEMARCAVESGTGNRTYTARIDIEIVSQAVWEKEQIISYLDLIPDLSEEMSRALQNYTLNTRLFSTS